MAGFSSDQLVGTLWGLGEGSGAVAYRIGRNGHLGLHRVWEEA